MSQRPSVARAIGFVAAIVLALPDVGCIDGPGELGTEDRLPRADLDAFVGTVQPILEERCASPSCHGRPGRPFELYAVQQHRLDEGNVFLDRPLEPREHVLNFRRACSFVMGLDDPDRALILSKPLAPERGGAGHEGGVLFEDRADRDYQRIRAWIADAIVRERESR